MTLAWLEGSPLATAPAVWGKLSEHGDFVHHRCSPAERRAWAEWVQSAWLTPARVEPRHRLPVAFVLPVNTLPFAPHHLVQGVLIASRDRVGRTCPLVIFQRVSPDWFRRLWVDPQPAGTQGLLFWCARLAVQAVQGQRTWADLRHALDALWPAHAPGWLERLGRAPRSLPPAVLQALLGSPGAQDPAAGFQGVEHLPWTDWPERLLRQPDSRPAFWSQDLQGRWVHAADSLAQLWRPRP